MDPSIVTHWGNTVVVLQDKAVIGTLVTDSGGITNPSGRVWLGKLIAVRVRQLIGAGSVSHISWV